jgi:hypothetical protein
MPRHIPKFLFNQPFVALLALGLASLTGLAHAQSSCSSDKQPRAIALVERFLMADCADCWAKASASGKTTPKTISLDWIVPSKNDDAALSAAAVRDSLTRLGGTKPPEGQTLERSKAASQAAAKSPSKLPNVRLRVAHGLGFNGYIGTSIGLYSATNGAHALRNWPQGITAHIALIENLPAGAESSPMARNLVRNYQMSPLNSQTMLYKKEREGEQIFFDSRPLSVPEGAKAERLAVVGWLEDAQGNVLQAVASKCATVN